MKKFKFKDGSVITASTVEEAKAKHKVMAAGYSSDWNKEKDVLNKNGFKIKVNKHNGHIYVEKRMPGHKDIFANIYKTQKGKFEVVCYVEDTSNSVTDCVYESDLREISCTKKTLKDAFVTVNTYFKLVERCVNLHKKYEEDMKELNNEAYNLNK